MPSNKPGWKGKSRDTLLQPLLTIECLKSYSNPHPFKGVVYPSWYLHLDISAGQNHSTSRILSEMKSSKFSSQKSNIITEKPPVELVGRYQQKRENEYNYVLPTPKRMVDEITQTENSPYIIDLKVQNELSNNYERRVTEDPYKVSPTLPNFNNYNNPKFLTKARNEKTGNNFTSSSNAKHVETKIPCEDNNQVQRNSFTKIVKKSTAFDIPFKKEKKFSTAEEPNNEMNYNQKIEINDKIQGFDSQFILNNKEDSIIEFEENGVYFVANEFLQSKICNESLDQSVEFNIGILF